MAKIVWKTTPKAAYEWVEVEGGSSMSHVEQKAFLDEFIEENGLVPVESSFIGEVPVHKYGRYVAGGGQASALPPAALPTRESDLNKANAEVERLKAELARANDQLGKKQEGKSGAKVVEGSEVEGIGSAGRQTTEDARDTLNQQEGVEIVPSGEEVREDATSDDKSDDNPVRRGRPRRDA